jgi:hypothetical protein
MENGGVLTENPICCPICFAHWDFGTTWLGEVVPVHPVSKCVPRPAPAYEQEDEEPVLGTPRECEECHQIFTPQSKAAPSQTICGPRCRKARRERRAEYKRRNWKVATLAQLSLPFRTCDQCKESFVPSSKFSGKQILCGRSRCKAAREKARYQSGKRRAA